MTKIDKAWQAADEMTDKLGTKGYRATISDVETMRNELRRMVIIAREQQAALRLVADSPTICAAMDDATFALVQSATLTGDAA